MKNIFKLLLLFMAISCLIFVSTASQAEDKTLEQTQEPANAEKKADVEATNKDSKKGPVLFLSDNMQTLETPVEVNELALFNFTLRNDGDEDLKILDIQPG